MKTLIRFAPLLCLLWISARGSGQELNCRIDVIAPQISNVEASIFESLEDQISEFVNGRKWTNDNFRLEERIECTMQITISDAPTPHFVQGQHTGTELQASLQQRLQHPLASGERQRL